MYIISNRLLFTISIKYYLICVISWQYNITNSMRNTRNVKKKLKKRGESMKITDERKDNKIEFQTLNLGDVFKWENEFFIKTWLIENREGLNFNAVRLENGAHTYFAVHNLVEPLDAELIIRG